jgi:hypothetical protein
MKTPFQIRPLFMVALLLLLNSACKDKEVQPQATDGPVGATTTLKTGTLTAENGTPTAGMLSIVRDQNNKEFLSLNDNFKSDFGTGTIAVYLAKTAANIKSQRTNADGSPNGAGNVKAIGFVDKNGKQYLKLPSASTGFSYVVFYCETVEINFGNALLQ